MSDIPYEVDPIPVWLKPIEHELTEKEREYATANFHPLSNPSYTKEVFEWFKKTAVRLNLCKKERAGLYVSRTFPTRFESLYESAFNEAYPDNKSSSDDTMNEVRELIKLRPEKDELEF
tara:strand:+ start:698 stop:1054 length:357 start_codon:yes stop_codon:yes gene_type:complete